MKIYLDLEANCTTNEAISIGMVTENGDTFYSLIRPHTKLDHNIKVLTGVSQEDADQAPSLEEAMLGVREFLSFLDEENTFYHYGKSDRGFLRASMGFTTDMKALTTCNTFTIDVKMLTKGWRLIFAGMRLVLGLRI